MPGIQIHFKYLTTWRREVRRMELALSDDNLPESCVDDINMLADNLAVALEWRRRRDNERRKIAALRETNGFEPEEIPARLAKADAMERELRG